MRSNARASLCYALMVLCCFGLNGALDLAADFPEAARVFGAVYLLCFVGLGYVAHLSERSE